MFYLMLYSSFVILTVLSEFHRLSKLTNVTTNNFNCKRCILYGDRWNTGRFRMRHLEFQIIFMGANGFILVESGLSYCRKVSVAYLYECIFLYRQHNF